MNSPKEKIAAIVVTYNRKELLKECLDALLKQTYSLDSVIIIDNASTDGTEEFLKENDYLGNPKIDYVKLPQNTGGAGGFYEGVKRGYEKGYDWLWLMDDDAEPKKDALERLEKYFSLENISALACLKVDKDMNILHPHRGYFNFKNVFSGIVKKFNESDIQKNYVEIDHASFVGILVSSKAIMKIGFPQKDFFIHYDDVEYCIRLRTVGKILLIPNSVIIHKEAAKGKIEKCFLGKKSKRIEFDKLWLSYYGIRNLVWLGKQYSQNKILFYVYMIRNLFKAIMGIIIYDDHKCKRIQLLLNAYCDGLKDKFDNSKPKRILYEE